MMPTIEKVLLAILEDIGVPMLLKWLLARTPEDQARAILEGEYAAARAAADAEAKAAFGEGP